MMKIIGKILRITFMIVVIVILSIAVLILGGLVVQLRLQLRLQEETVLREFENVKSERDDYQKAAELSGLGYWKMDLKTNEVWWSSKMYDLFKRPEDPENPLLVDEVGSFIHPDDFPVALEELQKSIAEQRLYDIQIRVKPRGDEEYLYFSEIAENIYDEDGNPAMTFGIAMDVTQRVRAEQQVSQQQEMLLQSQKMESIGRLAGGIAHDFNNMLGGVIGFTEMLKESALDEEQTQFCDLILEASNNAAGLTQQLLSFARKSSSQSSDFLLDKCISNSVELLSRTLRKNIEIDLRLHSSDSVISGDESQVQNIILNLGLNARDAMPDGGTLTIESSIVTLDQEYCEVSPFELVAGDYVKIEVRDTGFGIEKKHIPHLFEPFFSTKEIGKGTGLGLASAYGIVVSHKGAITVYSELGEGTSFHIYLPKSDVEYSVEPVVEAEVLDYKGAGKILIVDDEDVVRKMADAMLSSMGFATDFAWNGQVALEKLSEWKGGSDFPVGVLLDVVMPVLGGGEALKQIREEYPDLPVLMASGFAREKSVDEFLKLGAKGFLKKPYTKQQLMKLVSESIKS